MRKYAVILLNGTAITSAAYIDEGTIYLPIGAVCKGLGYQINWIQGNVPGEEAGFVNYMGKTYMEADLFSEIFGMVVDYSSGAQQMTLNTIAGNNITIQTEERDLEGKEFIIHLKYPKISGLNNEASEKKINAVFEKAASDAEAQGLNIGTDLANSGYLGPQILVTDLNYIVKYNQNSLLSIILYNYQYAGGAHGTTAQSSYTFDLNTGKELKLGDLLNENTNYTSCISSLIRHDIDERIEAGELVELTRFTTIGENPPYYLFNDSFVFYFQQYEYFPYAAGIQEFAIKFSALKNKFTKEYEFLSK